MPAAPGMYPNNPGMRFDTASITKLFTAVATLQMIDQGQYTFETGVIDFLGLEDTSISREVNVFQLLTHTSGIGDDAEEEDGELYEDLWKTRPNYWSPKPPTTYPCSSTNQPTSRRGRAAATAIAALYCSA